MAKSRINQILSIARGGGGGRVLPRILHGAIDVYQTSFKLLGKTGNQPIIKILHIMVC